MMLILIFCSKESMTPCHQVFQLPFLYCVFVFWSMFFLHNRIKVVTHFGNTSVIKRAKLSRYTSFFNRIVFFCYFFLVISVYIWNLLLFDRTFYMNNTLS